MERKYLNWGGLVVSLLALILGFVVLFAKVELLGIGFSFSEIKEEIDMIIATPESIGIADVDKSDFAGTLMRIIITQVAGWAAIITGFIGLIGFGIFSLEEAGKMNTNLQGSKWFTSEVIGMVVLGTIAFIVGFIVKGGVMDTYVKESSALLL